MNKRPIDILLDQVDYKPIPGMMPPKSKNIPYATHEGILKIGDIEIKVYVLNDGRRVIDAETIFSTNSIETV
jgi:hypothetical protein